MVNDMKGYIPIKVGHRRFEAQSDRQLAELFAAAARAVEKSKLIHSTEQQDRAERQMKDVADEIHFRYGGAK
jgi:hypothetical protein